MRLFGFKLLGIDTTDVECPRCGKNGYIMFYPSERDLEVPFPSQLKAAIKEAGLTDFLTVPECDDLHFFCMHCTAMAKKCSYMKSSCKIEISTERLKATVEKAS